VSAIGPPTLPPPRARRIFSGGFPALKENRSMSRVRSVRAAAASTLGVLFLLALVGAPASALQQRDSARSRGDSTGSQRRAPQARDTAAAGRGGRAGAAGAPAQRSDTGGPNYGGLRLRSIGPAMISGRITDVAVHPRDKKIWYVATASGGLWKTTTAGNVFTPIFDGEASYSIGTVVIDPKNPNVVWVGTGESNAQRSVSYGDGIYKSVDAGRTWQNMGLKESEHIGKILIDPRSSDVVYVAAHGPLFKGGGDRGLYKTTDGGKTWKKLLPTSGDWAGVADVVMDPRNPDVLIASTWQRFRRQWGYIAGGPESGLWRSTDGGATWKKSQAGFPANEDIGRIGLAISPMDPNTVYAIAEIANARGGFFRSRDNGVNWERMSSYQSGGLYYNEIIADPHDVDRVYSVDVRTMVTDDAGRTFRAVGERNKHVDNHSVWVDPDDVDHLIIGCDGGLYESWDRGQNYRFFENLPLAQFYRVETDNTLPFYRVLGGTQDNMSVSGPSRTRTDNGIVNSDWFVTAGGDGFQSRADPKDPNIVYAESQHGNLSRFDIRTGESVNIVPQGEPGEPGLKWHWDAPLIISPFSNTRLYFASNRVYRSDDRGDNWRPISGDLSRQIDRNTLKMMGRVWSVDAVAKNTSTSQWGAVVSVQESPLKEGTLWIGTDDGLIQVTSDGGQTWRRIDHIAGIPDTTFIQRVQPSSHDANTAYASFDNHKAGDYKPYIAKTTDLGRTWTVITGNLPERGTVYVVIDDPKDPNMLYAGTEFGLYFTRDGGQRWTRLRGGLPTIMVRDLTFQRREDDLVVATFGRGFYILDDVDALRGATPAVLAREGALFPVPRAPLYIESSPLGGRGAAHRGAEFFTTPNPAYGATFTYYLRSELRTRRARRQAADRAAAGRGEDVRYPPWDSLRVEDREEAPAMVLTVTDPEGRVVRRLTGPVTAGFQRVTWDLRYPAMNPPTLAPPPPAGEGDGFGPGPIGPLVAPGTYTVTLAKRVDGETTPVGEPQKFEVYMLDGGGASRTPAVVAFQEKTAALQRAILGAAASINETQARMQLLKRALDAAPNAPAQLRTDLDGIEKRLQALEDSLSGDPTIGRRQEPTPPSLTQRFNGLTGGFWSNSLGAPTGTMQRQYEIVSSQFGRILEQLRTLVETDLRRVESGAEAAGAPWTTGRVPVWRP
jgi:photosystem II stability/assembly factor-like uncharacterized protein